MAKYLVASHDRWSEHAIWDDDSGTLTPLVVRGGEPRSPRGRFTRTQTPEPAVMYTDQDGILWLTVGNRRFDLARVRNPSIHATGEDSAELQFVHDGTPTLIQYEHPVRDFDEGLSMSEPEHFDFFLYVLNRLRTPERIERTRRFYMEGVKLG